MLDGLLGRGFSSKCKSSIKQIKARIDVIRRKRNAMQKFLKKDIADLLANNLETNAYGRAEGLIVELNLSFCYDLVEQFCGSIPRHLSVMQKQSVCPEEVREAVSSLLFAAARFADLPELRDLRQMFTEKYGNAVEPFVNREFKEKLSSNSPTVDQKLQLMRDIAKEYSVKWDSKEFQLKLSNPVVPVKDQPRRVASFQNRQNDGNKPQNNREAETALKKDPEDVFARGRREPTNDVLKSHKSLPETAPTREKEDSVLRGKGGSLPDNVYKARTTVAEEVVVKKDTYNVSSHGRPEVANDRHLPQSSREATDPKRDNQQVWSRRRRDHTTDVDQPQNGMEETQPKRDVYGVPSQGRHEFHDNGFKHVNGKEDVGKRENMNISSHGRRELTSNDNGAMHQKEDLRGRRDLTDDGLNLENGRKEDAPRGRREQSDDGCRKDDIYRRRDILSYERQAEHRKTDSNTDKLSAVREKDCEVAETAKPQYKGFAPPPYVKPPKNGIQNDTFGPEKTLLEPPMHRRYLNVGSVKNHDERQEFRPAKVNHVDEYSHHDDFVNDRAPKPKPMSVRRQQMKPPLGYENPTSIEGDDTMKRVPSARRREARNGLQHALHDDPKKEKDEEEQAMDQLLLHYSKKPTKYEPIMVKERLNSTVRPSSHNETEWRRPSRATSLPPEPATPPKAAGKGPSRATSFQPDRLFVHPKLPEYDDLAARMASLRER
ncbi:hypothetical protein MKW94_019907 [Papaver nudicaule]|uniref:IST1-like protein n=1 Tax=Papaver nudicaule TaxID=74823 RepID=A0AA41RUP3_PAPNU|nr:hypothetical protein [Papaver nudicaule]